MQTPVMNAAEVAHAAPGRRRIPDESQMSRMVNTAQALNWHTINAIRRALGFNWPSFVHST